MKYIIKNCENFIPEYSFFNNSCCKKGSVINGIYTTKCKDIPYCLIKQIVELCEEELKPFYILTGNLTGASTLVTKAVTI